MYKYKSLITSLKSQPLFSSHTRPLPNKRLLTFEPQSFQIILSTHRNDQSFIRKLEMTSLLGQKISPVISGCIRGVSHDGKGSSLISWKVNRRLRFCAAKTEKYINFGTEMGEFKLYNAWHKNWICKFTIEENSIWRERASFYQIISIRPRLSHACNRGPDVTSISKIQLVV